MAHPFRFREAVLRAASQLEIRARRNVSALLAGNYRSTFRGSGMQFKEFRHYEPGDDIRHMSWQVTARTKRATIKTYEEEREIDVILAVDVSGSSISGRSGRRKIDMYAEIAALLGLAAVKAGDNFGLLLFDSEPQVFLPPKRTRNQITVAVTHLLDQELKGKRSDLTKVFPYLQGVLKHRSLILVLSDFRLPPFDKSVGAVARKHELVLLQGYDAAEAGKGIKGVYEVWDPETQRFAVLDANSKRTMNELEANHAKHSAELERVAKNSKADYLSLCVEDDYLQKLVHFFRQRGPSRL